MRPGALGQRCCTFLWLGNLRLTEAVVVSASAGAQAFSLEGAAQAFPRQRPPFVLLVCPFFDWHVGRQSAQADMKQIAKLIYKEPFNSR